MQQGSGSERRRFPRIQAPVYYRPAGLFGPRRQVADIGFGGARIYSDEELRIGKRLSLELFLPDGGSVKCTVRVAWTSLLPPGAPARYDVGLQFLEVPEDGMRQLSPLLDANGGAQEATVH